MRDSSAVPRENLAWGTTRSDSRAQWMNSGRHAATDVLDTLAAIGSNDVRGGWIRPSPQLGVNLLIPKQILAERVGFELFQLL